MSTPATSPALLCIALDSAYPVSQCRRALEHADGDTLKAVEWLISGTWIHGQALRWDQRSLEINTKVLMTRTAEPYKRCKWALMRCAGNFHMALLVLNGQPVLH